MFLYSFPEKLTTNFCHTFHTSPTSDCQNFSSSLDIRSQEGKKAQSEVTCHFGVSWGAQTTVKSDSATLLQFAMVRRVKKFKNICLPKAFRSCCIELCSKIKSLKKSKVKWHVITKYDSTWFENLTTYLIGQCYLTAKLQI